MSALASAIAAIDSLHTIPPLTADDEWRSLGAFLARLKHKLSTPRQPDDGASAQQLCDYVGRIIPPCPDAEAGQVSDEDHPEYEQVAHRSREIAPYGLGILQVLGNDYSTKFSVDTLLTVISFTNPAVTDPWTTHEACDLARDLLSQQLLHHFNQSDLIETILKDYLRPAFSKSRSKAVTASGRKSEFPEEDDPHRGLADDTKEVKPWKYEDHRAITVFHWVVLTTDMLRDGVFSAYFHVKDHVRIVEVLLTQASKIVDEMQIHAVKHLKDLIPMHSEVLSNPFAALAPATLCAAIRGLQAIIANCWPRLSTPAYQDELIKALVVCYLTVHDEQDQLGARFEAINAELVKTASMLTVAARGAGGEAVQDLADKAALLVSKEPLLAGLFK
ncbi:CCA tRNA nucleotidyltransferase, mitochondrial [Diaporthe eres]